MSERRQLILDRTITILFYVAMAFTLLRPSCLKFRTPLGQVSLTSALAPALLLCAAWLIALLLEPRRYFVRSGLEAPLVLFLGIQCMAAAFSPFGRGGERGEALLELCLYAAVFYASLYLIRDAASCRRFITMLFAAAVAVALIDLAYHWGKGLRRIVDQGYPFWDGKNALGLFMALALGLSAPLAWRGGASRWGAAVCAMGLLSVFLCGIYSYSRGAWLAMAAVACAFALMRSWKTVLLIALAALVLIPLPHTRVMRRVVYTGHAYDVNAATRVEVWQSALALIGAHPLRGVGPGEFRTAAHQRAGVAPDRDLSRSARARLRHLSHAHNLFLQVGAEAGMGALLALLWACIAVARKARAALRQSPDGSARGIAAALAGFLAFSLVDCSWTGRFTGNSFMHINLIMAVTVAMLCSLTAPQNGRRMPS